jgi:hypothetical protein
LFSLPEDRGLLPVVPYKYLINGKRRFGEKPLLVCLSSILGLDTGRQGTTNRTEIYHTSIMDIRVIFR